jgi:hypothetical protein
MTRFWYTLKNLNPVASKCDKLIIHHFWVKNVFFNEEIHIVVIVFNFDFEVEMNRFVSLCVRERECA